MRAIDIEVVDDFVSPSYLKAIQDSLSADSFDWHFQASQSLTEWDEYKEINWKCYEDKMNKPAWVFDTRSILNSDSVIKSGINYWRLGVGPNI